MRLNLDNENVGIYRKKYQNFSAWAWRRVGDVPEWRVTVKFGDEGFECEPGIYCEPLDVAISEVETALTQMQEMYQALLDFRDSQ